MAEEHRCQAAPEAPRLCANNCGFFGSPATLGLCSKCFRDHCLKEEQEASAKMAVEKSLLVPSLAASSSSHPGEAARDPRSNLSSSAFPLLPPPPVNQGEDPHTGTQSSPAAAAAAAPLMKPGGRCTSCRKKVGLTGFRCRCGETFCSSHRYPEQHACTYDFKTSAREAIARANPVVKADKLDRL